MLLKVVDNGEFKDIPIKEGEMFLLPGTSKLIFRTKHAAFCPHWILADSPFSFVSLSLSPIDTHCSANTPHNPVRFENTVGIVIEKQRPAEALGNDSPENMDLK